MTQTAAEGVLPVVCLAGPTACGKTDLALHLAEVLNCEVINTDSRQIYADFPLICAQPDAQERKRCPHHLYGILETSQKISAGEWRDMALSVARSVLSRGRIPLFVGGTGMYFHTLLHGIAPIPPIASELRAELEKRVNCQGPRILHGELETVDPDYAAKIHPNDRQRIVRALEVYFQTGKTLTWWHGQENLGPRVEGPLLVLAPEREWLNGRIARRIDWMVEHGAVEEAERAWASHPDPTAPGWSGIGCAELLGYLLGRTGWEECLELWRRNTRAYAKRQNTWFRGRREALFFAPEDGEGLLKAATSARMHFFP